MMRYWGRLEPGRSISRKSEKANRRFTIKSQIESRHNAMETVAVGTVQNNMGTTLHAQQNLSLRDSKPPALFSLPFAASGKVKAEIREQSARLSQVDVSHLTAGGQKLPSQAGVPDDVEVKLSPGITAVIAQGRIHTLKGPPCPDGFRLATAHEVNRENAFGTSLSKLPYGQQQAILNMIKAVAKEVTGGRSPRGSSANPSYLPRRTAAA
jgi:hypothetical protein